MKIRISTDRKEEYDQRTWARMINSLSGFKSANLVGTASKNKTSNLSIVSSVVHLGATPPLMAFVLRPHSEESPRHTLLNLWDSPFFTINHVGQSFFEKAHQTSARYPQEESEFKACGLTEHYHDGFPAPFVKESQLQIGLKLSQIVEIEQNQTRFVIGEIMEFHVEQEAIRSDGYIDIETLETVCVSGLDGYHKTEALARLSYAKPDKKPTRLNT